MSVKRHVTADELTRFASTSIVSPVVSTVGAGLPSFAGRTKGDLHYDTVGKKEYVLTGAPGGAVAEPFNYPNGTLTGKVAANGQTWFVDSYLGLASVGAVDAVVSNNMIPGNGYYGDKLVVGDFSVGGSMQCTAQIVGNSDTLYLFFGAKTTDYTSFFVQISTSSISAFGQGAGSVDVYYRAADGTSTRLADIGSGLVTAGVALRSDLATVVSFDINAAGAFVVRYNGVVIITGNGTAAQVASLGTAIGFLSNANTLDDFSALCTGTLAWTPAPSAQEVVNTVAASGPAVTLPDVDTASLHRVTLTANTTITLPTPAPGKSLTVVTLQDGPSPAAPTGLTATAVATGGTFAAASYFWKVTALNAAGESLGSNEATAAIVANGSANLAWTAVTGATGYKVYRSTTAGAESTSPALVATLGAVTTYTDTGTATTAGAVPTTATTGGRTVTFATPSGVIKYAGGTAPTATATAGKADVYSFICTNVDWYALVAGQNF